MVKEIETENWDFDRPTVVKFYATWCGPCKMFAPRFERIAQGNDSYDFVAADVEQNVDKAKQYGVQSIPTVLLVDGNDVQVLDTKTLEETLRG